MTYDLAIGDRAYSSWSLRGWLLFDAFGIPVRTRQAPLYTADFPALLADYAPARTVPVARTPEGGLLFDSLAIAETLAEAHPEAGIWPADPVHRAAARSLAAEMHSSYTALRSDFPMILRHGYAPISPSAAVAADLARIETLWAYARQMSEGPWLFGAFSAADVFFTPVAARIAAYGLPTESGGYVQQCLTAEPFRRWRAMAMVDLPDQASYAQDRPSVPWPFPPEETGQAVETGTPENATCPYSGQAPDHLMAFQGRTFGFCNPFCRDKTAADPLAWPAFSALLHG